MAVVQGTGNNDYLPKWESTGSSVLIDSNIIDDGSAVSINSALNVGAAGAGQPLNVFGPVGANAGLTVTGAALNVGTPGTGQPLNAYGPVSAKKGLTVSGSASALNTTSYGVYGYSGSSFGVYGLSNSSYGVCGYGRSNSGVFGGSDSSFGVYGRSDSIVGVYGESGSGYGVYGGSDSSFGVLGASNSRYGVVGHSVKNVGVYGYSGDSYGVYGHSSFSYAGYFQGNVKVTGTLSKAGGTFTIDHPLDPDNRYLHHSFVESPERKNVYDGIAVCDAQGEAVVELPAWFEPLNRDLRYQLTPIGAPASSLHVAAEVEGGRFKIAGGAKGLRVSWQVTGVRQDAWAKANPLIVEEDKAAGDRGFLLHPEARGLPANRGIHHEIDAHAPAHLSQVKKVAERARAEVGPIKPAQS